MKKHAVLLLLANLLVLTGYAASSTIRWLWNGQPVQQIMRPGERLEFGLRDDGVVVWREINTTTNSPAEKLPYWSAMQIDNSGTNFPPEFPTNRLYMPHYYTPNILYTNSLLMP